MTMPHDPFSGVPLVGTDAYYNARNQAAQGQAGGQEQTVGGKGDPAAGTVDEVKARVEAGEVSAEDVLAAEQDGKQRKGLLEWLRDR